MWTRPVAAKLERVPTQDRRLGLDFERDGAVCVRGAVSPEHVALARDAIDANLAALSPRAKRASAADDGAFVEDFCNWSRLRRCGASSRPPVWPRSPPT